MNVSFLPFRRMAFAVLFVPLFTLAGLSRTFAQSEIPADPENLQVEVNTSSFTEATVTWNAVAEHFELRYRKKPSINEGFENGIPEGWTTIDADGDGYTWIDMRNIGQYTGSYDISSLEGKGEKARIEDDTPLIG